MLALGLRPNSSPCLPHIPEFFTPPDWASSSPIFVCTIHTSAKWHSAHCLLHLLGGDSSYSSPIKCCLCVDKLFSIVKAVLGFLTSRVQSFLLKRQLAFLISCHHHHANPTLFCFSAKGSHLHASITQTLSATRVSITFSTFSLLGMSSFSFHMCANMLALLGSLYMLFDPIFPVRKLC